MPRATSIMATNAGCSGRWVSHPPLQSILRDLASVWFPEPRLPDTIEPKDNRRVRSTSHDLQSDPRPAGAPRFQDLDYLLEPEIEATIAELGDDAPLLARMIRFHLGWAESNGESTTQEVRATVQGKRIRPAVALLTCAAAGGAMPDAAPLAASIELLHNFTLIHDDIQDRSPNRRHRATVWRVWGDGQAINAGDALFAAAHLALYRLQERLAAAQLLTLAASFDRTTLEIVRGQVQDLGFEGRVNVSPDNYLAMIINKTAAILRFAAWAGASVGGADADRAAAFGEFGQAVGIGFQIRDDLLGIWGDSDATGKDAADDIRRRKQSLPLLLLHAQASDEERSRLQQIYRQEEIGAEGVDTVLAMLATHEIERQVADRVRFYHDQAAESLRRATDGAENAATAALFTLIDRLAARTS